MSDNPFLLPPDARRAAGAPAPAEEPPAQHPGHYIAVPASVESATHRINRPAPSTGAPDGGAPAEAAPADAALADAAPADAAASEETRLAPLAAPDAAHAWELILPDGSRVRLTGPVLLGRDPAPIPERPDARLLPVRDEGKTVSKTHALVEPAPGGGGILVHDLFSTNGVAIDARGGRTVVTPGGEALAGRDATIALGSFGIGVAAIAPDPA
jgi:hypothetical protein